MADDTNLRGVKDAMRAAPQTPAYDSRPETWEHINEVRKLINGVIEDLMLRSEQHDQSKLHSPEVEIFDRVTPRLKEIEYGSEEYYGELGLMKVALEHHYSTYRHHPEHHHNGFKDMNLIDLVEMLCDWIAAGKRMKDGGDIHRSIMQNQERFGYSDEIRNLLHNTVDLF